MQVLAWLQLKAAQVKDAVQGLLAGMEEAAQLAYVISFLVSPAAGKDEKATIEM